MINILNLKIRIKNKEFWMALVPALFLLTQAVASLFGLSIDLAETQGKLILVIDAVFVVLAILGIVNDPTTKGLSDSTVSLAKESVKDTAQAVIARELTNSDYADILSKAVEIGGGDAS